MSHGRLVVTGGRGMVGHNFRDHPTLEDWEVFAPSHGELDLLDAAATLAYLDRTQPDVVVHAAGLVGGIHANMARPVDFLTVNTEIGRNVILGARTVGVPRLLNLASSCIYPREGKNPLAEESILTGELEPTNEGYALAKIYALRLCEYIRREDPKLQYKTFVPCNLYGRYDNFDPRSSHLIPGVIDKLHRAKREGSSSVAIWGDGSARREFMFAGDLADAMARALTDFETVPDLTNIGLGEDCSVREYYEAVAAVVGWTGAFEYDLSKPVGMARKLVDITRQSVWGWAPTTSLHGGLEQTYRYYLREIAQEIAA